MSYTRQYENSTDEFANDTWKDDKWGIFNHDNPNYINWITYNIRQIPEYKDCTLDFEDNNTFTTVPQENTVINENQSNTDIPAETAGYNTSNIANECFTAPPSLQEITSVSRNPNIKKSTESTEKDIVNETSYENTSQNKDDLDIYPKFQEHYAQEEPQDRITHKNNDIEPIDTDEEGSPAVDEEGPPNSKKKTPQERQDSINRVLGALETKRETLLLEEKEVKNFLRKAKNEKYYTNTEIIPEANEKDEDSETEDSKEPQDNMRNIKKSQTNYNLSILDFQKAKSKLLNIDNE